MEKLKNIQIIFTDIDGTLSNSSCEITKETATAIKKATENGILVILCSGRNNIYVSDFSKKCNASNYIISCNGAEIFDYKNNKHIDCSNIDTNKINTIWNFCKNNDLGCILNCESVRYSNNNNAIEEKDKIITSDISNLKVPVFQIVTYGYNYNKMNALEKLINNEKLHIINISHSYLNKDCSNHHFFFDTINNNINKGTAIKSLLEYLNIDKENAIGFGDHVNDYDMFNEVGFKVAMANANPKLKEKADYITLSNDENGVAYFLNNFIEYNKE